MDNKKPNRQIQGIGLKDHQIALLATFMTVEMKKRHKSLPESTRTEIVGLLNQFLETHALRLDLIPPFLKD